MTSDTRDDVLRPSVPQPPSGRQRLKWWGPGLLWAMSAVGSGSVLFTPRIGSVYGYSLLWLLLGVAALMWVMIREAGRYAVVTGRTLLDGFSTLPGPRNWALWVVFLPQLVAAVAGVGGLSALVGSTIAQELPGDLVLWSLVVLAMTTLVVVSGGYPWVSRVALVLALGLVGVMIAAAFGVFEADGDAVAGLVPSIPGDLDIAFILPWIGTILAGSMGIIWYSYWAARRGYGGPMHGSGTAPEPLDERVPRLKNWLRTMSNTAAIGVMTGTLTITAFLVLGAELLGPEGIVPQGTDVANDLTRLLSDVWGPVGHWLMVAAIVIALGGSVLANQDGWSRSFADIVLILWRGGRRAQADEKSFPAWANRMLALRPSHMSVDRALRIVFAVTVTCLVPAIVVVIVRDPVAIMSVSGIIATLHTPLIVFATLAVNRRLPEGVRPGLTFTGLLAVAGLFYSVFAVLYFANLLGAFAN
ncbi:Nramp family divalent metal transporter [Salinibacterium sp. SYSU T00001]|uniref:Nramp family divalent metal transporter n=1 Tax=Homoserinimonas sedimenticola TaxID=2986805 RepID=UPI00223693B1|nr:Nramp family divalent metal transporter [Salinibacterium sedimenticola]MCW4385605.1 Nramp family divalent metal transporter [Salinibacterium sedimenticola]